MTKRKPFAVLLASGNKDATASQGDDPAAIPDEDDESVKTSSTQASSTRQLPAALIIPDWADAAQDDNPQPPNDEFGAEFLPPTPKASSQSQLRQSTVPKSNEIEELRQIQQKLLQQKEELRQKQAEVEAEEKALLLQTNDSEDEGLEQFYEALINPSVDPSLAPSPTLQQGFFPTATYPYFNYPPQLAHMNLPQLPHQPINRQPSNFQRSMHPSQYRRPRPVPQPEEGEYQRQPHPQQARSNDGLAAVPQPLQPLQPLQPQPQANATPSQVESHLPAETFKIFNKIQQKFQDRPFNSDEVFVKLVELREKDVHAIFKSGRELNILYDNLEVFLRQYTSDNTLLLRRHQKAPFTLQQKDAWSAFLQSSDDISFKGYWEPSYLYPMLDCCRDAAEMYFFDICFPKVTAYPILQHLPPKMDTLFIDFRRSESPSIVDVFAAFSLDCEEGNHKYTSLTTIVSTFPTNEIFDTTINKLRQYVSEKLIVLVDEKPYDSYVRILKARHFVVDGFATYFGAKESFVVFQHASNDSVLCIGLRAQQ
uniref:Uncharacterized protein n=1 Tax=Panagrolaimus davidi TaxID=227884 RepID=A0A914R532_9BILA